MKAKLIKTEINYLLENEEGVIIASTSIKKGISSLSKQNCDDIFGVVDVEKLADEEYPSDDDWTNEQSLVRKLGYEEGFNKAMELNKDKMFTLSDISYAISFSGKMKPSEIVRNLLQQPTEIEVEIVTVPALSNNGNVYYGDIPKLDADGCLILKRKRDENI